MMTAVSSRPLPAPQPNVETQPFWDAAAEGRLTIKRCRSCNEPHYPPRGRCPFCFSDATAWEDSKGKGTIYSFSTMRRGPNTPYVLAYVTLDEGPAVMTNIVDCDPDTLAIGDRVEVVFTPTEGGPPVPFFKPAAR